jgi:hypothetical protein
MNFEQKVFMHQFPIVKMFIYHLIYHRVLLKSYQEHQLQNEFWTLTIDAHLLRAVTNWCMVFGSDKSEPTHWKQLSITDSKPHYIKVFARDFLRRLALIDIQKCGRFS